MTFDFRPATRENVNLIISLIGGTGSGKTYSAMRLATGMSAGKKFAVIDTEAGRAKHYADAFDFDHGDLGPPFRPNRYLEAIRAADAKGYPVVVVDSASHEHAGDGGLLEWHDEELTRMAGEKDWVKRTACNLAAWIVPKSGHKKFVSGLLQLRCQLILCFRAEEKVKMERQMVDGKEKNVIVPIGWQPICEKSLPYESTCSFVLTWENPGVGKPIKLEQQHRSLFPAGKQLDEECGRRILEWATGGKPKSVRPDPATSEVKFREDHMRVAMMEATKDELVSLWQKYYPVIVADREMLERLTVVKDKRKAELGL